MKRFLILTVMTLAGIPLCAYVYWDHVCACPKEPGEHFAVWNPLRDFGPEVAADRFFLELAKRGLITDWDLSTRRTEGGTVRLTYYVTGRDGDRWLEYVEVERASDGWTVVRYTGAE